MEGDDRQHGDRPEAIDVGPVCRKGKVYRDHLGSGGEGVLGSAVWTYPRLAIFLFWQQRLGTPAQPVAILPNVIKSSPHLWVDWSVRP
jgi:hypothetical protein